MPNEELVRKLRSLEFKSLDSDKEVKVGEFFYRGITLLRTEGFLGVNSVFSGFNKSFRDYYGNDSDPVKASNDLVAMGLIEIRPAHKKSKRDVGSVIMYLAGDLKKSDNSKATLSKMGIAI